MYFISLCTLPASPQLAGWHLFILLGRVCVCGAALFWEGIKDTGNKDTNPQGWALVH